MQDFSKVSIIRHKPQNRSIFSEKYQKKLAEIDKAEQIIRQLFKVVKPAQADLIFVLGGDGLVVKTAKTLHHLGKPFFGINFGTRGFLLNSSTVLQALEKILLTTEWIDFPLLEAEVHLRSGEIKFCLAFNDVFTQTVNSKHYQSAQHEIFFNDINALAHNHQDFFAGDGLIVCTPGGSSAYNKSAGGFLINPKSQVLGLTPICPCWPTEHMQPIQLPDSTEIKIVMLEDTKRKHVVVADNETFTKVDFVIIRKSQISIKLGFQFQETFQMKTLRIQMFDPKAGQTGGTHG